MLIHATSPIRRSGTSFLSPIPNEIYIHIFGYLKPLDLGLWQWHERTTKHLLFNIALVCRLFSVIIQPWAFESLRFDAEEDDLDVPVGSRTQSHVSFCRSILEGKPAARTMAQHVKKCTFDSFNLRDRGDAESQWYFEGILSLYSSAMRRMPNIQELAFTKTPLTKELVKAIVSLRQLTSLKLENCILADDVKEKDLQKFSSLKLKHIDVGFSHRDYEHLIPLNDLVLTLKPLSLLNVNSAIHIATSHSMIIQLLAESDHDLQLESLEFRKMDMTELRLFSGVFSLLPFLKSLQILEVPCIPQASRINIPKDSLPVLEDVDIPLGMCPDVIPGRPIVSITARGYMPEKWPYIETLWSSSRPVCHLHLSSSSFSQIPLWKHFPDIRTLHVDFFVYDFVTSEMLSEKQIDIEKAIEIALNTWPTYPPLHSLIFDFEPNCSSFNLAEQYDWISRIILPNIPTLRHCKVTRHFEWLYSESDSSWNPTVIPSQEQAAVTFLKNKESTFVDYEECFAKILASSP